GVDPEVVHLHRRGIGRRAGVRLRGPCAHVLGGRVAHGALYAESMADPGANGGSRVADRVRLLASLACLAHYSERTLVAGGGGSCWLDGGRCGRSGVLSRLLVRRVGAGRELPETTALSF